MTIILCGNQYHNVLKSVVGWIKTNSPRSIYIKRPLPRSIAFEGMNIY